MGSPVTYPAAWAVDVVTSDGATVELRPLRPDDGALIDPLLAELSDRRPAGGHPAPGAVAHPRPLEQLDLVDYAHRMAFVVSSEGRIIAIGAYERSAPDPTRAEVALVVAADHRGRGLATLLLEHLAAYATAQGIGRFTSTTPSESPELLRVFDDTGWSVSKTFDGARWEVSFALDGSALDETIERERRADVEAARRILEPRSVAVIGAGRRPESIGHVILRNIVAAEFTGVVYPINPNAASVAGVGAHPTVASIGVPVDLAVITVPVGAVPAALEDCAAAGVGGVVVITAGFAETGSSGRSAQRRIVEIARRHGMRLVGPNCLGVLNATDGVSLNATFSPTTTAPGRVAFLSQSGALGLAILDHAAELRIGLSSFVSVGNKADLSSNDFLQYWESDPNTEVILLYLESFGNPRKFSRIARRVSRSKPIVVVKSGRSRAGRRGAASHTAALTSNEEMTAALFLQAGIIRVDTLSELFDVARTLSHQPLPAGRRVAVVGNSGGPGILAADACVGAGLEVPELTADTQAVLRSMLPPGAAVANPVDVLADSGPDAYVDALQVLLTDDQIDAVIVIHARPTRDDTVAEETIAAIRTGAAINPGKPVLVTLLAGHAPEPVIGTGPDQGDLPVFAFPEQPARALGRIASLVRWRDRPVGRLPHLDGIESGSARALAARVVRGAPKGRWLGPDEISELLGAFGIPLLRSISVDSPRAAADAARSLGTPVALKVVSDEIVHKTDVGGVRLDLETPEAVEHAYVDMAERIGPAMLGALCQPMVEPGVETIVGVTTDPSFGPVVLFGLGGTGAELIRDRAVRIAPLTDVDASELVREPRTAALLRGYRGAAPVDLAALEDLVLRVGRLADEVAEVVELDLNPVIVGPEGLAIPDARVRLAPPRRSGHPLRELP